VSNASYGNIVLAEGQLNINNAYAWPGGYANPAS